MTRPSFCSTETCVRHTLCIDASACSMRVHTEHTSVRPYITSNKGAYKFIPAEVLLLCSADGKAQGGPAFLAASAPGAEAPDR